MHRIILLCLILSGCMYTLPESIALHVYDNTPGVCRHHAARIAGALQACGYEDVRYCSGKVLPEDEGSHAWVEYRVGKETIIIDASRLLLGHVEWYRSDLRDNEYVKDYEECFAEGD